MDSVNGATEKSSLGEGFQDTKWKQAVVHLNKSQFKISVKGGSIDQKCDDRLLRLSNR